MPTSQELERLGSFGYQGNAAADVVFRQRHQALESLLNGCSREARVLDVGCGVGAILALLQEMGFRHAAGVDLDPARVEAAVRHGFHAITADAAALPFAAADFHLITCCTLFSSVTDAPSRRRIGAELGRVLAPGGAVLWYDFVYKNPANHHTVSMTRARIQAAFPGWDVQMRPITPWPFISYRLYPSLVPWASRLRPLLAYRVGWLRPPAAAATASAPSIAL